MNDCDQSGPAVKTKPAVLIEPIEWRLWKDRLRREAITVSLSTYQDRVVAGIRIFTTSQDGKMLPTTKGVTVAVARLPELATAVNRALKKARELGLLPAGDSEDAS
jgi:hypothetical protein